MRIEHLKTHEIQGVLVLETGLHIGSGRDAVEIGGVDSPVIKHPYTQQPYIPGSSLKGKLRSLLEWALGKVDPSGRPWGMGEGHRPANPDDVILRIFGTTDEAWSGGPTRLILRDLHLQKDWVDRLMKRSLPMTEDKTEVIIDRIQGKAGAFGPRTIERIPAGARFDLEILFRAFSLDGDGGAGDLECLNRVLEAMKLLEKDALGGSGSRGYGKVRFRDLVLDGASIQEKFDSIRSVSPEKANPIAA